MSGTPERTAAEPRTVLDVVRCATKSGESMTRYFWEPTLRSIGLDPSMSVDRLRAVLEAGERALGLPSLPPLHESDEAYDAGWSDCLHNIRGGSVVQHQDTPQ